MIRRLIILLLIVGCGTEPEDCAGVEGGNAVLDDCGTCDSDVTNDGVELWGECYNIEETTYVGLFNDAEITGEIPPEICDLTNLETLYMYNNALSGNIPDCICNLPLRALNLRSNQLSGEIPENIWNIKNLAYLNLGHNQLSGEIPESIVNFGKEADPSTSNQKSLFLGHNELSGVIPESICNIPLNFFSIDNNKLCPPYPPCLGDAAETQDTSNCP